MKLNFQLQTKQNATDFDFRLSRLLCIGFAGRDKEKVMEHILELEEIGVPRPEKIPTIYPCSNLLLTQDNTIQVLDDKTSGEVEFAILVKGGEIFIGLCSDHTDRSLETVSIPKSKQICPKPIAKTIWKYDDVKDHWDELTLRSWITVDGKEKLYQEGRVDSILKVEDILEVVEAEYGDLKGMVIFSGTVPTQGGFVYGDKFKFELEDPVLGRKIFHEYSIEVLMNRKGGE
jgi:hypothetical protein